ncbi:MAG: hypothetical protein ABJP34_07050 [Erythrobacter sp.]
MPFLEKSAWVMGLLLTFTGGLFLKLVVSDGVPAAFAAIPFVLFTIVGSIVLQVTLVAINLKEAGNSTDEREAAILYRAGYFSSYCLAAGVLLGLGQFVFSQDGNRMFFIVMLSLILAQMADYAIQIFLFRKRV